MSIAGLKLTFPSRTRLIRGLATMVLHIRVWESSSMPGFFLPKLRRHSYEYDVFFWNLISRNFATMVLHLRVWESCGRESAIFFCVCFVFSAIPLKNPQSIINYCLAVFLRSIRKSCTNARKIYQIPAYRCRDFFCSNYDVILTNTSFFCTLQ